MSSCPSCDAPGCYTGLTSIECVDPSCNHFSRRQCKEFLQEYFHQRLLAYIDDPNFNEPIKLPPGFSIGNSAPDAVVVTVPLPLTKGLAVHMIQYTIQF